LFGALKWVFHKIPDIKPTLLSHIHFWAEGKCVGYRPLLEGRRFEEWKWRST